jgi:SAM-dependent methyltransferase
MSSLVEPCATAAGASSSSADDDGWDSHVIRIFRSMKSPMRPDASEIAALSGWVGEWIEHLSLHEAARIDVLLFGVTVEILQLQWPPNVCLTAVDRSELMIREFWPGEIAGRRHLVRADWDDLPFPSGSFHFVLGDGVMNVRRFPDGYLEFAGNIRRLLRAGGCFFARAFLQAEPREDPSQIVDDFRAGLITDYDELRFRFLVALQMSVEMGLNSTKELIDAEMQGRGLSLEEVYSRTGYRPPPPPSRVGAHAPAGVKICFPTATELQDAVAGELELLGTRQGTGSLASRCPLFGFRAPMPHDVPSARGQ